ncbi:MAG TPA: hypothetical protein VMB27_01680 [Solirubrobacteraceae bacterium]|nr:hypothetical protein [Solirubrobacteraceae bacterium]
MTESAPATTHELHSRVNDGIHVRLLWRSDDDHLWVSVTDTKRRERFALEVRDREFALDVFHHPYAYAAHYGIQTDSTCDGATAEFTMCR